VNAKDPASPQSLVVKRSIVIGNRRSSVSLEDAFWNAIREIAAAKKTSLSDLITKIDDDRVVRKRVNLSSAIRLFVLDHYRRIAEHKRLKEK